MNTYFSYLKKNRTQPFVYHLRTAKYRFAYQWSKHRALNGISISDRQLRRAMSLPINFTKDIGEHFRMRQLPRFFINPSEKDRYVHAARRLFPDTVDFTIKQAEQACDQVFDLLGSGPVGLGAEINWHQDFKSGYQWPCVYFKEIDSRDYEKRHDMKVPRELSRFQHLSTLGKAYWYTNDEKYAQEFVAQIDDWIKKNPPQIGVNWQCAMDVAIRIVNWIWGFYFFKDSKCMSDEFIIRFLKSCLVHGRHISRNLEWNEQVTSNHYVSDLVGLVFLGTVFPEFKGSREWLDFGTKQLLQELHKQVYDDGMNYEASTAYHRLVLELYYSTALLSGLNGREWPEWAWQKIRKMFEFVKGILKPNGEIPQIGDNDSGRLQILEKREDVSQSYLLPIAAILFDDSSFKLKDIAFPEEALWLLSPEAFEKYDSMPETGSLTDLPSCSFENAGLYVMRSKSNYCAISCGPNGQNGNGGHAHNDKLSFELSVRGVDVIVDPGTYVYTGDYQSRNLFRSTGYHNTVVVDKKEINEFDPLRLFQLRGDCETRVHSFGRQNSHYVFIGEHAGYNRLDSPVRHTRYLAHDEENSSWEIVDQLAGPGHHKHQFEQHFHFAPYCSLEKTKVTPGLDRQIYLVNSLQDKDFSLESFDEWQTYEVRAESVGLSLTFAANQQTDVRLEQGWISSGYGLREKAPVLILSCESDCPTYFYTIITA